MAMIGFVLNSKFYDIEKVDGCSAYVITREGDKEGVTIGSPALKVEPVTLADHLMMLKTLILRERNRESMKRIGLKEIDLLNDKIDEMLVVLMDTYKI